MLKTTKAYTYPKVYKNATHNVFKRKGNMSNCLTVLRFVLYWLCFKLQKTTYPIVYAKPHTTCPRGNSGSSSSIYKAQNVV